MKVFIDTEFNDTGSVIDLISIALVKENGEEYYAVNKDANWSEITKNDWLQANVLSQLPPGNTWKSKAQIATEVEEFLLKDFFISGAPELWAWFASYDFVAFAQLWGRMLEIPVGVPQYIHDLRAFIDYVGVKKLPSQTKGAHDALEDARHLRVQCEYVNEVIAKRLEENGKRSGGKM